MGIMMRIEPTPLSGAAEIRCTPIKDERGWFARFFCQDALFSLNGGRPIQQINSSLTLKRGSIRGLHFQYAPHAEDRVVRCISGRVFDVLVDLRRDSPTLGRWHGVILDAAEMNMVYIPRGFAHGFQSLEDHCQLLYLHTEFHAPEHEGGFRYDSPALGIQWPLAVADLSMRDRTLSCLEPSFEGLDL